jgi:hypothetical protein
MDEVQPKRKPGRPRKAQQAAPSLPISVKLTLRGGKSLEFGCVGKRIEGGFWVFLIPTGYRIVSRYIAISEIGSMDIEEAAPQFQPMQAPQQMAAPQPQVSEAYSAIRGARLQTQAHGGMPVSQVETENGLATVAAGFLG